MSKIVPIIYMVGVLLLILPSFIKSNKNLKAFLNRVRERPAYQRAFRKID